MIHRYVPNDEILSYYHNYACWGHFEPKRIAKKILDSGFYWETFFNEAYKFCKSCEKCQRMDSVSYRNEMSQMTILYYEIVLVLGMDFIGPFPISCGFVYILLVVDYVSKWVEAKTTYTNDPKVIIGFLVVKSRHTEYKQTII